MNSSQPSISEFLALSDREIAQYAPETVVLGAGGTRRRAVLAGIDPTSEEYPAWTRLQMVALLDLLFQHGVKHIFTAVMVDGNFLEETEGYREHLYRWIDWGIGGEEALNEYQERGWQARLIGAEFVPALQATANRLKQSTPKRKSKCVWFTITPSSEVAWDLVFQRAMAKKAYTYRDAIRAIYGQDIPVDNSLLLDFGKPQVFTSTVPPLLICKMHCYWRQHLGYDLDVNTLRHIFYDFAFNRRTWMTDKSGRADAVHEFEDAYTEPPVVGMGTRLGPFWYPAAIPTVPVNGR